ncbi:sensor histidine kinase [Mucilaginibacter lacusdianchii]|uniref:sensor histidine kinase n=1 Tax=Mucilaginibacter lacusdianchii TaxID=2684211 RepID=UPI00131D0180|nr:GAF domain-containing protein [Mucilaginibacter sp. JXJ CY 39]
MSIIAVPQKEYQRLQAVQRFLNLELQKEKELQEIVELASDLCETPMALITLIGEDVQYCKFKVGTDLNQQALEYSFCKDLINSTDLLVIPDTLADTSYCNNPFVTGDPGIRFYAGAPLITHDGHFLGCLSVLDTCAREFSYVHKHLLKVLAKRIIQIMEFDLSLKVLNEQFQQVRESETKLRSFFESSTACHLLLGRNMEILAFNKNMAEFINRIYNVTLYEGIHVSEILDGRVLASFEADYQNALHGNAVHFQREVLYTNERIWWAVSFEPCVDCQGNTIGISYSARDITEHKLSEEQIIQQNESLKNIAHIQSHELRKPVASIMGLMHIIEEEDFSPCKEVLLMMKKAVESLDTEIRKIVNFTHPANTE